MGLAPKLAEMASLTQTHGRNVMTAIWRTTTAAQPPASSRMRHIGNAPLVIIQNVFHCVGTESTSIQFSDAWIATLLVLSAEALQTRTAMSAIQETTSTSKRTRAMESARPSSLDGLLLEFPLEQSVS